MAYLKRMDMMQQTINSIELYMGGNPDTIERLLRLQSKSVVEELRKELNASSLKDLAYKLSVYDKG